MWHYWRNVGFVKTSVLLGVIYITMENWLSQIGMGAKHLTDRYAEYPAPVHDQQLYYAYEPSSPSHGHAAASKHHYGGGGHKSNAAMSALTLLAFLFFLHILQQCLKEHMTAMSTSQVMVVSAGREGDQIMTKTQNKDKLDKTGRVTDVAHNAGIEPGVKLKNIMDDDSTTDRDDLLLTRIVTAEHTPQVHRYTNKNINYKNSSSIYDRFVSAVQDNF